MQRHYYNQQRTAWQFIEDLTGVKDLEFLKLHFYEVVNSEKLQKHHMRHMEAGGLKRWWVIAAFVMLVYSTLGVVRTLSRCLGDGFIAVATFILGVSVGIFLLIDRRPPFLSSLFLCRFLIFLIFIAWGLRMPYVVERIHLFEYGLLGWLCAWALEGSGRWPAWWPVAMILVTLVGYGDECIQWLLPDRVYDLRDVFTNAGAGLLGVILFATGKS